MNLEKANKIKEELDRPSTNLLEGKKDLVICEIGTQYGINAKSILERFDIKTFYLIDPYIPYSGIGEEYISGKNWKEVKKFAKEYLKEYNDKIVWVEKFSWDAINDIPNNLDFIYIDGEHTEEAVTKDLELYYPKVKIGGIFAGHDFEISGMFLDKNEVVNVVSRAPGVVNAVFAFFLLNTDLVLNCGGVWDWWTIKV